LRGFLDIKRPLDLVRLAVPQAGKHVDELGVGGVTSVALHLGFEGQYLRSTLALNTTGERKGLLRLLSTGGERSIRMPPMPPDSTHVLASVIDLGPLYASLVEVIEGVMSTSDPVGLAEFRDVRKKFEEALGFDIRKDLLEVLGPSLVLYNSPGEGPLFLGSAVCFEVRDAAKLEKTLKTIADRAGKLSGATARFRTQSYRGAQLRILEVDAEGFIVAPTLTIHDGWLVMGLYPQTVQGYVLRSGGKVGTWKPSPLWTRLVAETEARQGQGGGRIVGLSQSDPRPTMSQILSIAPILVSTISRFAGGGVKFDVSLIPNAQSVNEKLSPNVSLSIDDGRTIRYESYSTFSLPLDLSGLELYVILAAFGSVF
jgi:hypothetical protein